MWETRVWSLGQEDPLEKEMATHSSILARRMLWMEELGRLQSTGSQRVKHDWLTSLFHLSNRMGVVEVVFQSLSHVWLFETPWTVAHQASLAFTVSWSLLKFMSIECNQVQPSCPLSYPSHPVFNLSKHQGLFQWISSSHEVAKGLELQLQHQSFQWIFETDFLYDWAVWSPWCPKDSQGSSPALHSGKI